jgi:hypothetical protein
MTRVRNTRQVGGTCPTVWKVRISSCNIQDRVSLYLAECAYRRTCVLRTIASIQNQFLTLYSSRDRQCKLGYDSSSSCDSFQLGEMIKFLTKKNLLSLVPFQENPDYIWPEAYNGDVDYLISILRQCPSYQIDHNHAHCVRIPGFLISFVLLLHFTLEHVSVSCTL